MLACPGDRGKERVELLLAPGVDIDLVPPGQVRPAVPEEEKDRLAELLGLGGGEAVGPLGELTVLPQEGLLQVLPVLLLLDDEHPLPGIVLPEYQVEQEPDRRQEEEDHQPGHRRRRVPPLEEDDGDGEYDVEDQDNGKKGHEKGHLGITSPPESGMSDLSPWKYIHLPAGRAPIYQANILINPNAMTMRKIEAASHPMVMKKRDWIRSHRRIQQITTLE